jgi:hypothetical protein
MEQSGPGAHRWQGNKSAYPWEAEALDHIRAQLPDAEPYRAWQCITFTGPNGHIREVDLLIAVPGGLYLMEIKSHPGTATNNGPTWLFRDGDRLRTIENPLHFTDAKAKELKTQLEHAARKLGVREPIPRIEAAVFLSAPTLVCRFDEFQLGPPVAQPGRSVLRRVLRHRLRHLPDRPARIPHPHRGFPPHLDPARTVPRPPQVVNAG